MGLFVSYPDKIHKVLWPPKYSLVKSDSVVTDFIRFLASFLFKAMHVRNCVMYIFCNFYNLKFSAILGRQIQMWNKITESVHQKRVFHLTFCFLLFSITFAKNWRIKNIWNIRNSLHSIFAHSTIDDRDVATTSVENKIGFFSSMEGWDWIFPFRKLIETTS